MKRNNKSGKTINNKNGNINLMDMKDNAKKDIYSNSKGKHSETKNKSVKRKIVITLVSIISVFAVLLASGIVYYFSFLSKINRPNDFDDSDLGVNSDVFAKDYINIALYGIDARSNSFNGLSDAVIVLTIDKKHDKIKLTSIARDTYVSIEGHGKDKLTHVYNYSDGGAALSIKTLNQNFNLDITDYVTVNFYGITEIVDYIGGVTIDVDSAEREVMNVHYVPELNKIGIKCSYINKTGPQLLSGAQALAYARNRYTGNGDVERGNRQKEVLAAAYEKVMQMGVSKFPKLIELALNNSETSLSNNEITQIASWAAMNSPTIENLSLPDDECNPKHGNEALINNVWYYIYDLDIATRKIHDFINEEGVYYSSEPQQ